MFSKIKSSLRETNFWLKRKISQWLGIKRLSKEIHYNFIHINALDEYIKKDKEIKSFVLSQCKEHGIIDPENIKQLIKSKEDKNYFDYNNKILPETMKEIPQKIEGNDLS